MGNMEAVEVEVQTEGGGLKLHGWWRAGQDPPVQHYAIVGPPADENALVFYVGPERWTMIWYKAAQRLAVNEGPYRSPMHALSAAAHFMRSRP